MRIETICRRLLPPLKHVVLDRYSSMNTKRKEELHRYNDEDGADEVPWRQRFSCAHSGRHEQYPQLQRQCFDSGSSSHRPLMSEDISQQTREHRISQFVRKKSSSTPETENTRATSVYRRTSITLPLVNRAETITREVPITPGVPLNPEYRRGSMPNIATQYHMTLSSLDEYPGRQNTYSEDEVFSQDIPPSQSAESRPSCRFAAANQRRYSADFAMSISPSAASTITFDPNEPRYGLSQSLYRMSNPLQPCAMEEKSGLEELRTGQEHHGQDKHRLYEPVLKREKSITDLSSCHERSLNASSDMSYKGTVNPSCTSTSDMNLAATFLEDDVRFTFTLGDKSNKGASKQRRDQINNEIGTMRDLLPLPESSRQRLSQLQIMSLSCVFIRKCNILQKLFSSPLPPPTDPPCDFSQSLTGFILVTTRDGKLVYISENVTEYLGHSMVDMKTQGDSLFDIVDKRDHSTVRAQLLQGGSDVDPDLQVSFFCRMNMSRTLKRQAGFGDVKVMHVKGHFADVPGQEPGSEQQVFMALCTPLITPDVKESLIQNNTMVFKSVHKLDMNFIEVTQNGEYHLGKTSEELTSQSWYSFLHPEDIYEAREKHLQLIKSRHEMGCMMTVRMINTAGEIIWVNIVMHVRQGLLANSDDPVILCINQVVSEEEAYQFKIQGQLFALYASRTPDFFFGSAFCTPIPPGMDANLMTSQTSAMIPQPFFPRHFDSSQFGSQTASHFIQNQTSPVQPGLLKGGFEGRQGHTDTLKALKRKLQENFTQTTCKPMKIPRVMQNNNGRSGYSPVQESTPLPSSFETNSYRNVMNSMIGGMDHHVISSGPMKVMQAHSIAAALSPKDKSYLCDTLPAYVPAPVDMERTVKVLEQVVPDVTIPACYPTPEPSPVASPEPSKQKESTHSVHADIKLDPVLVAKHLCAIKQKQFHSKEMDVQPKKLLPSLDVTFVDSFFDEINNISLSREDEIRLLQSCCEETVAVKKEPIDDCVNPPPMIQPNFDLEEFLLTSRNIDSKRERGMGIKLEKPTDDQQVLSFDSHPSPTPSSPFSSTDDKMTCEDFPSFALTPESNFDSDPYEDVLGTECWDLESVTVDITMPTLTKQTTSMHSAASTADNELHQLKQLLSSWTPNGVSNSLEDSQ